ncbi:GNAT family N-acetyltransferase [Chryseobacterium sp. SN22]|uniref:GNAT family N-acetyltransferase n=1 Tax=Chryseobacterium sp. SN22 TaxID=2606431 RepID=UPI00162423FB|nr:GNAT family N-acetyltransferase [Chryseobacterium sp. SN22]
MNISSDRLELSPLTGNDYSFIFELVNAPGWLQFIGDRNIRTEDDAKAYILKINENPQIKYRKVTLRSGKKPMGIITWVKRDYLEYPDVGFAFLPDGAGQGYAFEATRAVLYSAPEVLRQDRILAITTRENVRSVKLLEKLKFSCDGETEADGKMLLQYSLDQDHLLIGKCIHDFYSIFSNVFREPEFEVINEICSPSSNIIKKSADGAEVYDLESFINPWKRILTDGTLTEFSEWETGEETRIVGTIAQRYSKYCKKGLLNGKYFEASGHKMFQLMKDHGVWKIVHMAWEDEV